MDLPDRVLIGPLKYDIGFDDFAADEDEGWLYGQTRHRSATIRINPNQALTQMRDTVLHEILHATFNQFPNELDHDTEEKFIRGLTPHLLSVIRFNPEIIEFLMEEDDG